VSKRVCIVGGGISGLCTAFGLQRAGVDVTLFEKGSLVGGNIGTIRRDGFLIERGPNSLLVSRELVGLISQLGLSDQIAPAKPAARKRFIVRDGQLTALPMGLVDLICGRAFSASAKLRLVKEPFVRTRSFDSESVAAFFERRLGREIVDYGVDPFISGIFAGDPERLSIRHAFSRVFEMERDHGSLLAGALFSRNGAKRRKGITRTISFKNGMQTLMDALAKKLGERVRLNTLVRSIKQSSPGFEIEIASGAKGYFDAVVVSTPAWTAAGLISELDSDLADSLAEIYYPPVAVVHTGFKNENVKTAPDGFGFLVPGRENMKILGSLWTSSVFEDRAPQGYHLFTTFIGGARSPEIAVKDEKELIKIALDDLNAVLGVASSPEFVGVKKWDRAIPQYNVGYESVIDAIENFEAVHRGIFFCSNFYRGISVSDCIRNSLATTDRVADFFVNN